MQDVRCPVCQEPLRASVTRSAKGRVALMMVCPRDGRHFRAFVNDRAFVGKVVASLEAKVVSIPD